MPANINIVYNVVYWLNCLGWHHLLGLAKIGIHEDLHGYNVGWLNLVYCTGAVDIGVNEARWIFRLEPTDSKDLSKMEVFTPKAYGW